MIFTRENIPFFGFRSWPLYLRLSSVFMHYDSRVSFAALYAINQVYRKVSIGGTIKNKKTLIRDRQ